MLFNSSAFLLFLAVATPLYYLVPRRFQNLTLLGLSYWFYGSWDWRFLGLLAGSTVIDYFCTKKILAGQTPKRFMLVSVGANLTALGFFKYFNFFVGSFRELLQALGLGALDGVHLDIVLPVGISFYTFQTMSFTIDAYRGRFDKLPRFIDYAVYVAYFPQLVAGPIERATSLLPQFEKTRRFDPKVAGHGVGLILTGAFKKVVIADAIAAPYADAAFNDPSSKAPAFLLLGVCMFALQIYGDFCGYSDIARGVSRLLGIELTLNFNQPYLSRNITEFWRRWHISLSSWLRDYLYIALGGNRHGKARTYLNLMATMLLGGLWHGASWNFVVWGGLHGIYLAAHKILLGDRKPSGANVSGWRGYMRALPFIAATNMLVLLTWVFFRAKDLSTSLAYVKGLAHAFTGSTPLLVLVAIAGCYSGLVLLIDLAPYRAGRHEFEEGWPPVVRGVFYGVLATAIWAAWPTTYSPFIYFQF